MLRWMLRYVCVGLVLCFPFAGCGTSESDEFLESLDLDTNAREPGHANSVNIRVECRDELLLPAACGPNFGSVVERSGFFLNSATRTIVTTGQLTEFIALVSPELKERAHSVMLILNLKPRPGRSRQPSTPQIIVAFPLDNVPAQLRYSNHIQTYEVVSHPLKRKLSGLDDPALFNRSFSDLNQEVDLGLIKLDVPIEEAVNYETKKKDIVVPTSAILAYDLPVRRPKDLYFDGSTDANASNLGPRPSDNVSTGRSRVRVQNETAGQNLYSYDIGNCAYPGDVAQLSSCGSALSGISTRDIGGPLYGSIVGHMMAFGVLSKNWGDFLNTICAGGLVDIYTYLPAALPALNETTALCTPPVAADKILAGSWFQRVDAQAIDASGQSIRLWIMTNAQ